MMEVKTISLENQDLLSAPRRRLLLVEDDSVSAAFQRAMLERIGWEVHVETKADGALNFIRRYRPDLVLTDLSFPLDEVDGFDVLLQNQSSHGPLSPNIVVVSGQADGETKDKASRLGARDFIAKPFAPEQYRRRLTQIMFEIESGQDQRAKPRRPERKPLSDKAFEGALTASEVYLLMAVVSIMLSMLYFQVMRYF